MLTSPSDGDMIRVREKKPLNLDIRLEGERREGHTIVCPENLCNHTVIGGSSTTPMFT